MFGVQPALIDELSNSFSVTPPTCLYNLLPESPPVGSAYLGAGTGGSGERHDLIDLAAGYFYFDGGVQEIGRIHD